MRRSLRILTCLFAVLAGSSSAFAEKKKVVFLADGGKLEELAGLYPSGHDGLAVTHMACAAHESIARGEPVCAWAAWPGQQNAR